VEQAGAGAFVEKTKVLDCRLKVALGNNMNGVVTTLLPHALETFSFTVPFPSRPTLTLHPARADGE